MMKSTEKKLTAHQQIPIKPETNAVTNFFYEFKKVVKIRELLQILKR